MLYPKRLEIGDQIGVTATSAGCDSEIDMIRLDLAKENFKRIGYSVSETDNVRKCYKGRSSDGITRAKELMQLFNNPKIRAIFAASGGDFLVEMLPFVDFNEIKHNPKWFQGYSDTTGLTFTITTNLDIATLYGNNFSTFSMGEWHRSLHDNLKLLEGQEIAQESFHQFQDGFIERITGREGFQLEKEVVWRSIGPDQEILQGEVQMSGRALGGCLDVLLNLVGTRFDKTKEFIEKYKEDGILWFLESYDLGSEALIRGLWQLKEAGWFAHAKGFIFGRPAMFRTYTDTSYEEAVGSVLGDLNLPIILDADIGHKPPQFTMMTGAIAHIQSMDGKGSVTFEKR